MTDQPSSGAGRSILFAGQAAAFGFPPVRLLRRQRFLRTLGQACDYLAQPLGQIIDPQYCDRAHINRDFKA